jgi:hypothetical protein
MKKLVLAGIVAMSFMVGNANAIDDSYRIIKEIDRGYEIQYNRNNSTWKITQGWNGGWGAGTMVTNHLMKLQEQCVIRANF